MTGILQSLLGSISSAAAVVTDAYFNLVTLLLPGNGTNGAQNNTFLDSSTNNFSITRNGNTTQGTFSPFSQTGWSNYFDGSSNLVAAANSAFSFASDFTVELWINPSSLSTDKSIFVMEVSAGSNTFFALNASTSSITVYLNSGSISFTATPASNIQLNTWSHIALVRSGSTVTVYVNGVAASGTGTSSATLGSSTTTFRIGGFVTTALNVCYISNFRVVNGRAVYTSAFTPPTAPLGATSGGQNPPTGTQTSLLTCQSNRFADNGGLATPNTMSVNGTPSVQAFSPFAPTAAYSAANVGGSGYFDGAGDYLTWGSGSSVAFGTGDFTVEAFIYVTSTPNTKYIVDARDSSNTGAWAFAFGLGGTGYKLGFFDGTTTIEEATASAQVNAWQHCVAVRSGTTLSVYLNGSRVATATNSKNLNVSPTTSYVGTRYTGSGYDIVGYISTLRIVKGTAVYDPTQTTLTIPTSPLTAITNTQLLLNYTNAGITDATAKNDLETVGNAQISTTQSKFGGSSMYFDGTGDGLVLPASPFYNFLDGNFTVEAWVYIAGNSPLDGLSRRIANIFSVSTSSAFSFNFVIRGDGTTTGTGLEIYNGTNIVNVTGTISQNTWHHIAVTKSGTSVYFFLNGTQMGTTQTTSGNWGSATVAAQVGRTAVTSYTFDLNGYIDDLRVTRGYARYTSNFTAPTAAFPLQ